MTHPELVKALCKNGACISLEMTGRRAHLLHMASKLCSEAGEIMDAVGKHVFYNQPLDVDNVVEELGDLEFYMEGLRQSIGYSREGILAHNIEKLTKRYGEKYSDQAAKERKDKQ